MSSKNPRAFELNPASYGLPTRDELVNLRIWDMHFHGFYRDGIRSHEENMFYVERMGIERMLSLDIAGSPTDPLGTTISAEQLIRVADGHQAAMVEIGGQANRVALSADESLAAGGTTDGLLIVVDVPSGKVRLRQTAHADAITAIAFAPGGERIATSSEDKSIVIWQRGEVLFEPVIQLQLPTAAVKSLQFTKDGQRLIASILNEPALRIWHLDQLRDRLRHRSRLVKPEVRNRPCCG